MPDINHQIGTLLASKLLRPRIATRLVERSRLHEILDSGLGRQLTLVIAPAGFGKTTLVSSWVQSLEERTGDGLPYMPAAWLSLDEGDSDRDDFLRYFTAAIRTIFPTACQQTVLALAGHRRVPTSVIFGTLSNEIEQLPNRFIVVLDDSHNLVGREVYDLLEAWTHHWPRTMHLVMISRYNPPLPLAGMRARDELTEIRSRHLRFTDAEAGSFLRDALGEEADEEAITQLQYHLEGWVAGLKLATLSVGRDNVSSVLPAQLGVGSTYIADYLVDQVMDRQTEAMQQFLLRTSIAHQFSASLCTALMSDYEPKLNAQEHLEQVVMSDLFVVPLDDRGEWYRFHQVFRDLLRQRLAASLNSAALGELYKRAAQWFADHGYYDTALDHAIAAGDIDLATRIVEMGLCDVLNQEATPTLRKWLSLFSDEQVALSPQLLVMKAWNHGFQWELEQISRAAEAAAGLLPLDDVSERAQLLRGQIAIFKGQALHNVNEHAGALAHTRQGLALLPKQWRYARGVACIYAGMSLYSLGAAEEARLFLTDHYESTEHKSDSFGLRLLLGLAINALQAGHYQETEGVAQAILRQAIQRQLPVMEGWGHYLLGFVNYQWNELGPAAQHFASVVGIFFSTQWMVARSGMIGQAMTYQAFGDSAEALESINALSRIDIEYHGREALETSSARARLLLMQGNLEDAERWVAECTVMPTDRPFLPWFEEPLLTRARLLVAGGDVANVQLALHILDALREIAERTFNVRIMIEVDALRAVGYLALGDGPAAQEALIRSVQLSRRGGFIRVYLDLGPQMEKLLRRISRHGPTSTTVSRILAAFEPTTKYAAIWLDEDGAVSQDDGVENMAVEALTPRELEILHLLAEPVSLRDIALRLNISYSTARRYTITIYAKLGVHSRWAAVEQATRYGVISPV